MKVFIAGLGGVTQTFRHWPERVLACALTRRGHRVQAIGTRDETRPPLATRHETIDYVEVFRVRSAYPPNVELLRVLSQIARPDIIHFMHPRNVLAAQIDMWAKWHNIPTVYTWLGPFHDEYATKNRERPFEVATTFDRIIFTRKALLRQIVLTKNPRDALRNYWLHRPLQMATALIPCSEFEATIMHQFGLRQPQQVVPLWIDVPFIQNTPVQKPDYGFPRPWLLFVGQLTIRKGYDLVIQAMPRIVAEYPQASLLIVSGINQAQRQHVWQLAQQAGVERHIHLLGYLPDEALINLYRASDALLFPTRFEGFGLPLLEAMAAQCPIITTNIPVVNEIVQHEQNGLLVEYNNARALAQATLHILQHHELREHLIANGLATLHERYSEERLIIKLERFYGAVVQGYAP